jgi:hypothetical protein
MWSDNETDVDLLQSNFIASSIVQIIKSKNLLPTTVGVFGDWGSGKSSLLKMVQNNLTKDKMIMTLNFNGWLFEGFEDAKTALMGSILDEINERIKDNKNIIEKAGGLLVKLSKRVNWFQLLSLTGRLGFSIATGMHDLAATGASFDATTMLVEKAKGLSVEDAKKLLKEAPEGEESVRRNIREFRNDFARLLEAAEIETLVVFVDDLDRCLPDTVIETLEAIKLFLFVPRTAFILGADERLIEYAVRRRFPELPGTDTEVGRDYLEKLIQIPIRIPPLGGAETHSYINLLFAQISLGDEHFKLVCETVSGFKPSNLSELSFDIESCREIIKPDGLPVQLEQDLDLAAQVAPILAPGLGGNPRRTKRFLNALLLRMQMATARGLQLRRQVLAKLMLLEYLKPEFFKQLATLQANQDGQPEELAKIESYLKQPTRSIEEPAESADSKDEPQASAQVGGGKGSRRLQRSEAAGESQPRLRKTEDEERLPAEIQSWLADSWMKRWLASDPLLKDIDLRPYFYIAHDTIGALGVTPMRLSPQAKQVLDKLLDSGIATQNLGVKTAEQLSVPDATAVFDALAQRVRQSESLDKSPEGVLTRLVQKRADLMPQFVSLYGSLPETKLQLKTPTMLFATVKDSASESAALAIIEKWSKSTKVLLAKAAEEVLTRAKKSN